MRCLESCSLNTTQQPGLCTGDQLGERLRQATRRRYSPWNAVVELTVPAFESAHNAAVRLTVLRNCLLVVCRVKRLPAAATEGSLDITRLGLAPEYVTDPFSGQPLRVVHQNGGWYVYSVWAEPKERRRGQNRNADGRLGLRTTETKAWRVFWGMIPGRTQLSPPAVCRWSSRQPIGRF